jgi:hypothetical protein
VTPATLETVMAGVVLGTDQIEQMTGAVLFSDITTLTGSTANRTVVFDITGAAFQANFPVGTDQAAPFRGLYTQVLSAAIKTKIIEDPVVIGAFQPTDISGCILWLRADLGVSPVGGPAAVWADQSGVGDPNHNEVQAVGAQQPTLNAVDPAYNNQSTLSVLAASSQTMLSAGVWTTPFVDPGTFFFAGNDDGSGARQFYFTTFGGGSNMEIIAPDVFLDNLFKAAATTAPSIIAGVSKGLTSRLYVNGFTPVVGASGVVGAFNKVQIASNVGASFFLNGKMAEYVFYNRDLTLPEFTIVMNYLSARYAIVLAP